MCDHIRWLHDQIGGWVSAQVISADQAGRIRALYPEPKAATPWGLILFSGLGAVIAGLGIVLLLAYNWQTIPKFGKLGLIFGSLIAAQAGGLKLFSKPDWRRQLGEALCVLGTMLFGAGIWLVAQVYHIDEHYPTGFLVWGLGALAMAWAMPSVAVGALAAVALSVWGCAEAAGFGEPVHWSPLLVAAGGGALAWQLRSRLLLAVTVAGFYAVVFANAGHSSGNLIFPAAFNASVLLAGLAGLTRGRAGFPGSAAVLEFFGLSGSLLCVYLLTFHGITEDVLDWHRHLWDTPEKLELALYAWLPLTLALSTWLWAALERLRRRPGTGADSDVERWLLPGSALLAQVFAASGMFQLGETVAGIFNLIFLAIAAMWMARGCREGRLRLVVLGSLLLVALVAARYFDLFESLAARGLVFVIVGGVLFAEGFSYRRTRQELEDRRAQP